MRTVLALAALVALASATPKNFRTVDPTIASKQHRVLELFEVVAQQNPNAEYYKVGTAYDLKGHAADYTNKEAFDKFWRFYEHGGYFQPSIYTFSIFDEKWRTEAKILYDLFYYAKDFETLYKTAAWARVHLNESLFTYTFYIAVVQHKDTHDLILPAFYEIYPQFFANGDVFSKMHYGKMRGLPFEQYHELGIFEEGDHYSYYANYSNYYTYGKNEHKLAYFTEDIGWNSFYSYFHAAMPFWEKGERISYGLFKESRGEIFYYFYQQLLSRYLLERYANGLGAIPKFSWFHIYQYGYRPFLSTYSHPFVQRSENYIMNNEKNLEDLRFVRNYESIFLTFLEKGKFEAYNQNIDLHNSKAMNFVGNFWQANPDLYEHVGKTTYFRSYEMAARRILGGAYNYNDDNEFMPSALDFYQTSLRDPAFYQIYNKIFGFMVQYKKFLHPYSQDNLHFVGVKVKDVEVSPLYTFFDFYSFNATNAVFFNDHELEHNTKSYMVVQPRLNREPFTVKIDLKSDVEGDATIKIFMGPKYDEHGYPISLEDNWMNFVLLDMFKYKLTKGENVVTRSSEEFYNFKDDSSSIGEIYKYLSEGKLPVDMLDKDTKIPKRLTLPRGRKGGFPMQFFIVVYPYTPVSKDMEILKEYILDNKPFGYPFDRPVSTIFMQPNMFVKDVSVFHKGEEYPWYIKTLDYKSY